MEYIEVSAKTIDDALTEASIKLGTTSDKLEYEVIDKGSNGFLGIGSRDAVIKVKKAKASVSAIDWQIISAFFKESHTCSSYSFSSCSNISSRISSPVISAG